MKTAEAAAEFGSEAELARQLGISPQAIYQWGEYPPIDRQYQIQALTKNKLKATQPPRPDAA